MDFINDDRGQGAAEYLLLFGGVIIVALAAFLIYNAYVDSTNPLRASNDVNSVRDTMNRS